MSVGSVARGAALATVFGSKPQTTSASMVLENSDVEMIVTEIEVSVSTLQDFFSCVSMRMFTG